MKQILALAALALPLTAGSQALAHATFAETEVVQGQTARLTLRVPHGCGDEATLRVRIQIPEGLIAAQPMVKAGYNPFECIKTNINGAMNVIDAAIDCGVKRVVALSTDKASSPVNLYGATKLASDKMFVASNSYSGEHGTRFAVVRYGNVMGSRGSVIPYFFSVRDRGVLPITDPRMTRFMITLEQGVELVWHAFSDMVGGEIYVRKIPSMNVTDIARVIAPEATHDIIGIRPGEKLHEQMIGPEDAPHTYEYTDHFKILPAIHNWSNSPDRIKDGVRVPDGFSYTSDTNADWMSPDALAAWIAANEGKIEQR